MKLMACWYAVELVFVLLVNQGKRMWGWALQQLVTKFNQSVPAETCS